MEKINDNPHSPAVMYDTFCKLTVKELEDAILSTDSAEERGFYRKMLNLKLQTEQEKIIGERLI